MRSLSIPLLAGLMLVGCGASVERVNLGNQWPESKETEGIFKTWLRQGVIRAPAKTAFAEYLDLYALIRGPEVRTAEVNRHVEFRGLSPNERKAMLTESKKASDENFEILLFATTYHRDRNDFSNRNSIWKVDLIVNNDTVIPATSIKRDRRPMPTIRSEFPWTGDFAEVYTATFESKEPWSSSNKKLQLRVSSTLGNVKLTWLAIR